MSRIPVFISEMAQLSSLGDDLKPFWSALEGARSGVSPIPVDFSNEDNFPVRFGHFIKNSEIDLPALKENRYLDENIPMAGYLLNGVTSKLAGLEVDGLVWGHGQTGVKFGDMLEAGSSQIFTARKWRQALLSELDRRNVKLADEASVIGHSNACITGITTLAEGFERIARGEWRRAVVIVQELRCRDWVLWPYYKLGLLAKTAEMRPFALDRNGFVKGEGGAAFLLESEEAMRESGTSPYCRIMAAAFAADGWKMFEPRQDFSIAGECIRTALAAGGVSPSDVDYVNLYGSASNKSDAMETRLIKQVFGSRALEIPLSSVKPQVGHLNTAAAAIETLATALMIQHDTITPTLNLEHPDPECDLDFVPIHSRKKKIGVALKLAFGFGWSNAALVLGRP